MKNQKRCFLRNNLILFLGACTTALAVTMNMDVADAPESGIKNSIFLAIYKIIEKISLDLAGKGLLLTAITILAYLVYRRVWIEGKAEIIKYTRGLSLFLSVMYAAGKGFAYGNSLSVLYTSSIRVLKTIIIIIGFYFLYLTAIHCFYALLQQKKDLVVHENKIIRFYRKHPMGTVWTGIMGSWLCHILLRYPGAMSYDNWRQLSYYFGYCDYTTAQPIFHTWLFGIFIRFGLWTGSANMGLFLFIVFQSLIMSCVLAWSLLLMKNWKTPVWLRALVMGIYCIAPYYAGYASFPIKDFLYTAFFLLFLLYLMDWIGDSAGFWNRTGRSAGWVLTVCLFILCRKNGIYVYIPVAVCMAVKELVRLLKNKKNKLISDRKIIKALVCLILPLLLVKGTEGIITNHYNVQKDSPKEMLSLPFQQTARYVRDYGDEVTEEEKEAIARVLDYDKIPKVYLELTADPVKTTFHVDTNEELLAYFKVWFQQFLKHPLCYIEATWNQNYYVFAPDIDNIVYNKDCNVGEEIMWDIGILDQINFEVPGFMQGICAIMVSYYSLLSRLPVIGLLNNVAFYMILLFVMFIFMLKDQCRKELLIMLPLCLSFLIILAAPQIQNQPRYAFPIIYAMPTVVAFFRRSMIK